jgi:hypothetical protein
MLVDDVVAALNAREWPEYVVERLGPRIGDAVAPYLVPVVGASLPPEPDDEDDSRDAADSTPLGASKVGGLPHVDSDFVWPTEEDEPDEPLALVCQINLADAAAAAPGQLPETGLLYLFCIYDSDRAYGYEIDDNTAKVIYVPNPGPLSVAPAPAGLNVEDGVFAERTLSFGPSLCLEEQDEEGHYVTVRFDYAVEKAIDEELRARGGADCRNLQMLGRVHPFRSETSEMFDEETTELLLYVNGYTTARYAFGEGEFLVVIDRDQLAAGRLDAADVLFEPGT